MLNIYLLLYSRFHMAHPAQKGYYSAESADISSSQGMNMDVNGLAITGLPAVF